jgi:hypothetical protein
MNRLKSVFRELEATNREEAIRLLNDQRLQFPSLFILMPEIDTLQLHRVLNVRNKIALGLCGKKTKITNVAVDSAREESEEEHQALRWMLSTGVSWEGPSAEHDQYDAVIDYTAALLVVSYEDKEMLSVVAELIFRRNRKDLYIHDLVWAFFQVMDYSALRLIARYLLSANGKDFKLASKLLHINMAGGTDRSVSKERLYRKYLAWLEENRPYLYLTGEQFQMTSDPQYLNFDSEAKYLNREISPKYRQPLTPLDEVEAMSLKRFRASPREEQELLSDYSYRLRRRNMQRWQEWMQMQTAEQVLSARAGYEAV